MPASEDLLVGEIAIQLKFIDRDQLKECVRIQNAGSPPVPIGEVLLAKGYINPAQLEQILKVQKENMAAHDPTQRKQREQVLFGKVVIKEGLASETQVNECLRLQAQDQSKSLGAVMVEKGYLTKEQVQNILEHQLKKVMRCGKCNLNYNVLSTTGGKNAKCPRCRGRLEEVTRGGDETVKTHGEFSTMKMRAVRGEAPKKKKFSSRPAKHTCIICDHSWETAVDAGGRVRCPNCHTTFTPRD